MLQRFRSSSVFAYWQAHPLRTILLLALMIRLVSVVFSRGYGMVDDHFIMVETPQGLLDGTNYGGWYNSGERNIGPSKRSVLYPGSIFLIFWSCETIGITDPQTKMLITRLLHTLLNLLVPLFGFRIAHHLAGLSTAKWVGLLLALFWFMPVLSVRQLNEVVSMPLLMGGLWFALLGNDKREKWWRIVAMGVLFGLAFSTRYQNLTFAAGVYLGLLIAGRWKAFVVGGLALLLPTVLVHGVIETQVFGYPFFGKVLNYFQYNVVNKAQYVQNDWYTYLTLLSGILIPPVSLMIWAGWIRMWKNAMVFLPILFFLAFHSYFPSKQERFILPMVPALITIGLVGWSKIAESWTWVQQRPKLMRGFLTFFWSVNVLALLVVSPAYSKRSRVECMSYLHGSPKIEALVIEESYRSGTFSLPLFYLGQIPPTFEVLKGNDHEQLVKDLLKRSLFADYVLFVSDRDLEDRISAMKTVFPDLQPEAVIPPSYLDRLLHWLNPRNKNETVYIYRIGDVEGPIFEEFREKYRKKMKRKAAEEAAN